MILIQAEQMKTARARSLTLAYALAFLTCLFALQAGTYAEDTIQYWIKASSSDHTYSALPRGSFKQQNRMTHRNWLNGF